MYTRGACIYTHNIYTFHPSQLGRWSSTHLRPRASGENDSLSLSALEHLHRCPRPAPPLGQLADPLLLLQALQLAKHASISKSSNVLSIPRPCQPPLSLSCTNPSLLLAQPICVGAWPPFSPLLAGMFATAGIQTSAYSSVQAFCAAPGALVDCGCRFVPERNRWIIHCAVPVLPQAVAYCNQWCYCETVGFGPELFRPAGIGWRAYRNFGVE